VLLTEWRGKGTLYGHAPPPVGDDPGRSGTSRIAGRQPPPDYRIDIRSDGRQEFAILSRDPVKPKRPVA
jgi:hypothetical protein